MAFRELARAPPLKELNLSIHSPGLRPNKFDLVRFQQEGYLHVQDWVNGSELAKIQEAAQAVHASLAPPLELEAQLGYPGAPERVEAEGGDTPRRLLRAYGRVPCWDAHATSADMLRYLQALLQHDQVFLSQAHHNCLMTKTPRFSSDTGWHRDSRYWQFEKNELVTAWLALGEEFYRNGSLKVIPGSHRLHLRPEQFDENSFFNAETLENQAVLQGAISLELAPGDLLFFHCDLLHAATRNHTDTNKLSLVFTYFGGDNAPRPDTRSSSIDAVALHTQAEQKVPTPNS